MSQFSWRGLQAAGSTLEWTPVRKRKSGRGRHECLRHKRVQRRFHDFRSPESRLGARVGKSGTSGTDPYRGLRKRKSRPGSLKAAPHGLA
jgi:hypothetical protein